MPSFSHTSDTGTFSTKCRLNTRTFSVSLTSFRLLVFITIHATALGFLVLLIAGGIALLATRYEAIQSVPSAILFTLLSVAIVAPAGIYLFRLLNHYLTEMSAIALKHGGTIDKYVGDAIIVFFGAPQFTDDKDHALRCVRMAWEMQERMRELGEEWKKKGIAYPVETFEVTGLK